MRLLALAIGMAIATASHATDPGGRFLKSLESLMPVDRLEQLCDYAAMVEIRKDGRHFDPDRAVASAIRKPKIGPNSIETKGGAFRSRGRWYELSYRCTATPDHLKVLSFKMSIGKQIPPSLYAAYGLWE